MKKKIIIVSVCLFLMLAITAGGIGVAYVRYLANTIAYEDLEKYCSEHSKRHSQDFLTDFQSNYDGYKFFISADKDETKGQELFILKRTRFMFFPSTRYVEHYSTVGGEFPLPVSALAMTFTQENGEKYDTGSMIFYSANELEIESIKYTIFENGKEIPGERYFETFNGFSFFVNNLEMNSIRDENRRIEASFYNETGEKIYSNTYIY